MSWKIRGGNNYVYLSPGKEGRGYDLICYGADGKEGGKGEGADITSWILKGAKSAEGDTKHQRPGEIGTMLDNRGQAEILKYLWVILKKRRQKKELTLRRRKKYNLEGKNNDSDQHQSTNLQ